MSRSSKFRIYAWVELLVWLIIVVVSVTAIKYHHYQAQKEYKSYQIFMEDVDGLIVGSPVRYMGVQIGYVKKIRIVGTQVYIKFVITQKELALPTGVIATVEAFGLAGSKALELYPPDKSFPTDKLIVIKDPTRLGKVMGLFKHMFKEIDAIVTVASNASTKLYPEVEKTRDRLIVLDETKKRFDNISKSIQEIKQKQKNFKLKNKNSSD